MLPPAAAASSVVATMNVGGPSRTILVTGISKGLGRALALEMAKRGHTVIGCSRSQEKLDSLQTELSSASSIQEIKHLLMKADVRSDINIAELAKAVIESKGLPDIIAVNNAGTINKNNRIWEVPAEEFDAVIDTNVKGIANVLRHFLPHMVEKKKGIIVNMSSGWGRSGAAQVAPYCASKWAIEGMTRSVAKELPDGMAIVALSPGVVNTDMLVSCFGNSASVYQTPETCCHHGKGYLEEGLEKSVSHFKGEES
ncbi:Short-chain dehydrogenase/reductase SDR [Macleaya cordata]|uniref:Short-chain dehydrogenase/reductase SDR n=1 Tax=Macleaya cordata TaxID=56857 RepID=A0A200QMG6_MACCD|nr:Short-chain dehydrogenase/reductase SDR [Macleaya cordata]